MTPQSHPKPFTAAPCTRRRRSDAGRIVRGALARRGASPRADGNGARSRCRAGLTLISLFAAAALVMALFSATATAAITHNPEPFSPITGFTHPAGVAIDESTGNVFVADQNPANKILISGEEGGAPVGLASSEITGLEFEYNVAVGMAFDNSESVAKGTLYAYDETAHAIKRFTRDAVEEKYKPAGEIPAPGTGPAPRYSGAVGLTVDADGNVWLGDFRSESIYEWSPTGVKLHEYDTSAPPFPETSASPGALAIDNAGDLFVQQLGSHGGWKCPVDGSGELEPENCDNFLTESVRGVAYDPATNDVYFSLKGGVIEFDATSLEQIGTHPFGEEVLGGSTARIAVNSETGRIYVADLTSTKNDVAVFGPAVTVPTTTVEPASEVVGTTATLNGAIDPEGIEVTQCVFEYGPTGAYGEEVDCGEYEEGGTWHTLPTPGEIPTGAGAVPVRTKVTGLTSDGVTYHYRLVAENENGSERSPDTSFVTANTVISEPATAVASTSAMLHGTVRPEELQYTDCEFEYRIIATFGFDEAPCNPEAGDVPPDLGEHAVGAELTGLQPNTTYLFRLKATNSAATHYGQLLSFTTQGPPQIVQQRPLEVGQTTATLNAKIDPSGQPTTYHFEWGEDTSYGNRIPSEGELSLGSESEPISVSTSLTGLAPNTTYHFRVVAENAYGATASPGHRFQTLTALDSLPYDRAFELVSPPDKRPVGNMEQLAAIHQLYQVAESGDRAGYLILNGLEGSPTGGEVIYAGSRTGEGWSSTQISPPALVSAPGVNGQNFSATPGFIRYLDPHDLKCALVETYNPITADTPAADTEFGVFNLYRWNAADDTYTLITNRIPLNPEAHKPDQQGFYQVAGVSKDCSRIVFRSRAYSFISAATGLYEWDEGVLRDAALRPDGSTPGASGINPRTIARERNSVAPDGSFFFTASSDEGADAGRDAVFVRKGPGEVVDASRPTNGPTLGARYTGASPDGSHVFFLANYGIAGTSSAGPMEDCSNVSADNTAIHNTACDLYAYDVEGETLTDISADLNPADTKGAVVQGVMAMSEDGSVVYFATRGQLLSDLGRTYAQNLEGSGHANVYRYDASAPPDEALTYVGSLTAQDVRGQALILSTSPTNNWSSQANHDGSYFLYASRDDLGVNNPKEVELAYLFSAATGATACVSCPGDGSAPEERADIIQHPGLPAVIAGLRAGGSNVPPVSLSEDGRVVFNSEEVLAPGAIEGHGERLGTAAFQFLTETNVYEWDHGQVSTLATGAEETLGMGGPDGRDVFVKSFSRLSPHDFDYSADVYDVRSGGGFPPPAEPQAPCEVASGECQGPPAPQPLASTPASAAFSGEGNPGHSGRCNLPGQRARKLSRAAKPLRRRARRLSRAAHRLAHRKPRRARALRRRAHRLSVSAHRRATRAQRLSKRAKRCRRASRRAGR